MALHLIVWTHQVAAYPDSVVRDGNARPDRVKAFADGPCDRPLERVPTQVLFIIILQHLASRQPSRTSESFSVNLVDAAEFPGKISSRTARRLGSGILARRTHLFGRSDHVATGFGSQSGGSLSSVSATESGSLGRHLVEHAKPNGRGNARLHFRCARSVLARLVGSLACASSRCSVFAFRPSRIRPYAAVDFPATSGPAHDCST